MQSIKSFLAPTAIAIAAATASSAAVSLFLLHRNAPQEPEPKLLPVTAASRLAANKEYQGEAGSPFTLIEFMDYQCPPCKRVQPFVDEMLRKNKGKLRYAVRNLPLPMHKDALPAAIAAEAAQEQGRFWQAHDALIRDEDLSAAHLRLLARRQGVNETRYFQAAASTAKARVQSGLHQAETLGLTGTPSFLLCCPDGKVWELPSLKQVERYIR